LKGAFSGAVGTGECNLGNLALELVENLLIGDLALLKVLSHHQTAFITYATFTSGNHGIANVVPVTHVAVYATPAIVAITCGAFPWRSIIAGQAAAQRCGAVLATPSGHA